MLPSLGGSAKGRSRASSSNSSKRSSASKRREISKQLTECNFSPNLVLGNQRKLNHMPSQDIYFPTEKVSGNVITGGLDPNKMKQEDNKSEYQRSFSGNRSQASHQ